MLKTTRLLELAPKVFSADNNEVVPKVFRADNNKIVDGGGDRINGTVVNLSKIEKSKKLTCIPNIKATGEPTFLTPNAKKALNFLLLAFIVASIF